MSETLPPPSSDVVFTPAVKALQQARGSRPMFATHVRGTGSARRVSYGDHARPGTTDNHRLQHRRLKQNRPLCVPCAIYPQLWNVLSDLIAELSWCVLSIRESVTPVRRSDPPMPFAGSFTLASTRGWGFFCLQVAAAAL